MPLEHAAVAVHVAEALAAAVYHAWSWTTDPAGRRRVAQRLSAMPLQEALTIGHRVQCDWYGASARHRLWSALLVRDSADTSTDLEAIEVLDRLVIDLRNHGAVGAEMLALTHVAFHAGLNPIAICPEAAAAVDLLTVAAWLGLLHRGRRVMMPTIIAEYWLMMLGEAGPVTVPSWEPDAFLLRRAEAAVGLLELRRTSLQTVASGPVMLRRRRKPTRFSAVSNAAGVSELKPPAFQR